MITRRHLLTTAASATIATAATGMAMLPGAARAQTGAPVAASPAADPTLRRIPSTGEMIPAIGLGSWITFNVGNDPVLLDECAAVVAAFAAHGGGMLDSSPMYGSAQDTIGHALKRLADPTAIFATDKVWISDGAAGPSQIATSAARWSVPRFDLLQVHNLVSWEAHLDTLFAMKAAGRLRYVGITTSHGLRHRQMAAIMARHPIDFVQLTYNPLDRDAEARLLPLASEKGIGVIVNRPFQRGGLTRRLAGQPLPDFAAETGAKTWAQLILKFIVSHPAVTVAIPATTKVAHVRENKDALLTPLPDAAMRQRIADAVAARA